METVYTIALHEALEEYARSKLFRDIVDTGCFAYVDEVFVLDAPMHIVREKGCRPKLSEAALQDLGKCAPAFESVTKYVVLNTARRGGGEEDVIEEQSRKLSDENIKWIFPAIEEAKRAARSEKTVWELLGEIFRKNDSDPVDFESRTLLQESYFYRYSNKNAKQHDMETRSLVAIGAGYDLTLQETKNLMESIGRTFIPSSMEHAMYRFILTLRGWHIRDRNDVLAKAGVRKLGSRGNIEE